MYPGRLLPKVEIRDNESELHASPKQRPSSVDVNLEEAMIAPEPVNLALREQEQRQTVVPARVGDRSVAR